ncbi:MAG: tetratricopeptide repeat protein [Deltaproteobacteria bacterium]|nr:tetratricopeptide repeat protein [Deltaproteobacteria bacterium]
MNERCSGIRRNSISKLLIRSTAFLVLAMPALMGCSGGQVSDEGIAKSDFHYRLARNYYNDHNIAMAQREVHEALTLNPEHPKALLLRGFIQMGLKQLDEAAASFRAALKVKPDFFEARNNLGAVMMAQGLYAEAIRILEPLTHEPLYVTPWFAHGNLGRCYYELGDLEKARTYLEMAVFLNPRYCLGYLHLGIVHQDRGDLRDARSTFEKAIKNCPKFAEPYYHLGVIQQRAGEMEAARASFAKCVELAPETAVGKRCAIRQ